MGISSEEPGARQDTRRRRIWKGCQGHCIQTERKGWLYHCGSENAKRYFLCMCLEISGTDLESF